MVNIYTRLPSCKVKVSESENEVAQSCPTLCNPMDCSLPGFSVHMIFQARIVEWVVISFLSKNYKYTWPEYICTMCVCMRVHSCSCIRLFVTQLTIAHQAPLSIEFSRQEYWSGLPSATPGNLPNPGIEPSSPALQKDSLLSDPPGKLEESKLYIIQLYNHFLRFSS